MCSKCNNVVAVRFGNQFVSPPDILHSGWAPDLSKRARQVERYQIAECFSKREHLVVRLLHLGAKDSNSEFIYGSERERRALVVMDDSNHAGYLMWSDDDVPTLRQWFVVPERQRQGIGSLLLRYWAEQFAFPKCSKFAVESPNESTWGALRKLGYIPKDPKEFRKYRCYFVDGM